MKNCNYKARTKYGLSYESTLYEYCFADSIYAISS